MLVACGGGVTTDLVGFAAATILRGVRWAAVPTTLLGMIDAAIGGKTGINHAKAKNVIGAIWQPEFVYINTQFLHTLCQRQFDTGLGELVKYAGLIGEPMISRLNEWFSEETSSSPRLMEDLVAACVAYKAEIVGQDEREVGVRTYLNLGHTFGHGIEQAAGYGKLLHGEAVILGLLAALILGEKTGIGSQPRLAAYRKLVERTVSLVPYRRIDASRALSAMNLDKKRRNGSSRFVLLERPGKPILSAGIPPQVVRDAMLDAMKYYRKTGGRRAKNPDR